MITTLPGHFKAEGSLDVSDTRGPTHLTLLIHDPVSAISFIGDFTAQIFTLYFTVLFVFTVLFIFTVIYFTTDPNLLFLRLDLCHL